MTPTDGDGLYADWSKRPQAIRGFLLVGFTEELQIRKKTGNPIIKC